MTDQAEQKTVINPYDAWKAYWINGWRGILPLPYKKKTWPPSGRTGYEGEDPSYADCTAWGEDTSPHNICLRLPSTAIGLDVDHYGEKRGGDTLAALVERYGPLPATILSTSRGDGISGIRLYRVPEGTHLPTALPGIEMIQFFHRYVVCWPSVHPEGGTYVWIDERTGTISEDVPHYEDLPFLPTAWVEGLATESRQHDKAEAVGLPDMQVLLEAMPVGSPCQHVLLARAKSAAPGSSRHDAYNAAILAVAGAGRRGCPGAKDTLLEMWKEFITKVTADGSRARDEALAEWVRMILGALAIVSTEDQGKACPEDLSWVPIADPAPDAPPAAARPATPTAPGIQTRSMSLAAPLSEHLAETFRYGDNKFGWMRWDGRRWKRVDEDEIIFVANLWMRAYLADLVAQGWDSSTIMKYSPYLDLARLRGLVQSARTFPELRIDPADLDQQPGLFNCANGVIDLRTGTLREHDRNLLFTHVSEVEFHPDATHPDWDKAVTAFADKDAEMWVRRHLGGALTGTPLRADMMVMHHGQGANGKTTVLGAVKQAFGQFGGLLNDRVLVGGTNEHQTIYMELRGKRLMLLEELPESHVLPVDRVKKLVETPTITARGMGENPTTFTATHSVVISTNYIPIVRETDHGTWRRLVMVDYPHTFVGADKDVFLRSRCYEGKEQQQAVLAWLVKGSVDWYRDGGDVSALPTSIGASTDAWRGSSDSLGDWLEENFVATANKSDIVLLSSMRADFKDYQTQNGEKEWGHRLFTQRLRGHEWLASSGAQFDPDKKQRVPGMAHPQRVVTNLRRKLP